MKELSIEQKAKRYDEAIKKAREYDFSLTGVCAGDVIQDIFTELAESGDEKIRKWIYGIIKNICWSADEDAEKELEKMQPLALAWLEKQGEQKPAEEYNITGIGSKNAQGKLGEMIKNLKSTDKVEPKFKISDWIIRSAENFEHNKYLITEIRDCYVCEDLKDRRVTFTFKDVHKNFKLWDISDAKDGDVLEFGDHGRLVVGIVSYVNKRTGKVDVNCLLEDNKFKVGNFYTLDTINPRPATKERRDLLFRKMHEAGYEWDAKKKELKKIEQNHANVFNIYEKSLLEKFKQAVYDCAWGKVTCKEEGETQEEYAERWSEQFLLMVRDWADDYIDFTIQQELRNSYKKGKTDAIEKLHEQKPAWSEEDESNLQGIIDEIKANKNHAPAYDFATYNRFLSWLKSLKDRVQPKQEWSEEDEDILNTIINHFKVDIECTDEDDVVRWLKSLKERYTWKPSEKQMEAVRIAAEIGTANNSWAMCVLKSMYQGLKKLREESL